MSSSISPSELPNRNSPADALSSKESDALASRVSSGIYALSLAIAIALWFLAINAPLDLDETGSYWQISAGISKIWAHQFMFPSCLAYSYFLCVWAKLAGISEIALRVPSVVAMLASVYVMYLNARDLFDRESGLIAAILLSVNPGILFASIDVRAYAFEVLTINTSIRILIHLRRNNSNALAVLFGISAAAIVWFQYLFAVILPFLAILVFAIKVAERKAIWRQVGVAVATFLLAVSPTLPGFLFLLHSRATHVFDSAPTMLDLYISYAPGWFLPILLGFAGIYLLVSAVPGRHYVQRGRIEVWKIMVCVAMGLLPMLIMFLVSCQTSIHIFAPRYRLVSVPGVTLCWTLLLSRFRIRAVRLLFCLTLVGVFALIRLNSSSAGQHEVPWKHAMEFLEKNASSDNAPVLMCSAYIESDFMSMPLESAKSSPLFAPLSYYQLSVPVVPLPRDLNDEALRVGSMFLEKQAKRKHQRFLAAELLQHYAILDWLEQKASTAYTVRTLGIIDGFKILEFVPRNDLPQEEGRRLTG